MDVTDIISDGYIVGLQASEAQVGLFSLDLKGITRTDLYLWEDRSDR